MGATSAQAAERSPLSGLELAQTETRFCDYDACAARYRSFRAADCTFQPYQGPRRACRIGAASRPAAPAVTPPPAAEPAVGRPTAAAPSVGDGAFAPTPEPAPQTLREATTAATGAAAPAAPPPRAAAVVSATGDLIDSWVDVGALGAFALFWTAAFFRIWRAPASLEPGRGLHDAIDSRGFRR